ncbi:MAG: GreA/GreB family elongation factor, partial [Verrucomicrobiae bacterium]|nr:GreA/GreB family elongation factor [Verrucomicrobiae bacterium]
MARATDFVNPNTETVNIGTKVELLDLNTNEKITYSILGAWDFDEEKHIISYLSPLAKEMMHKKVGDVFEFGDELHRKVYKIESITAFVQNAVPNKNGQVINKGPQGIPEVSINGQKPSETSETLEQKEESDSEPVIAGKGNRNDTQFAVGGIEITENNDDILTPFSNVESVGLQAQIASSNDI